jgi:hypothetical protein
MRVRSVITIDFFKGRESPGWIEWQAEQRNDGMIHYPVPRQLAGLRFRSYAGSGG